MTWRVNLQRAFADWELRDDPDDDRRVAVLEWFVGIVELGPPPDSLPVPFEPDLYVCQVPGADVIVSFFAATYERLIIVKEILAL